MSHPISDTSVAPHYHGWESFGGRAMYIRAVLDRSVQHLQACGEAIRRWNEAVGARFLLVPDKGVDRVTFFEHTGAEWPFTEFPNAAGLTSLVPGNPQIYIRADQSIEYYEWVNFYAHEIGHAFGLADHPQDDINSIMSYQVSGRWLLSPSKEDVDSVAQIHGLRDIRVRPEDLDGIENITGIWQWDRYHGQGWRYWIPGWDGNTLEFLIPYETYTVKAKAEGPFGLRVPLNVSPVQDRWVYL